MTCLASRQEQVLFSLESMLLLSTQPEPNHFFVLRASARSPRRSFIAVDISPQEVDGTRLVGRFDIHI